MVGYWPAVQLLKESQADIRMLCPVPRQSQESQAVSTSSNVKIDKGRNLIWSWKSGFDPATSYALSSFTRPFIWNHSGTFAGPVDDGLAAGILLPGTGGRTAFSRGAMGGPITQPVPRGTLTTAVQGDTGHAPVRHGIGLRPIQEAGAIPRPGCVAAVWPRYRPPPSRPPTRGLRHAPPNKRACAGDNRVIPDDRPGMQAARSSDLRASQMVRNSYKFVKNKIGTYCLRAPDYVIGTERPATRASMTIRWRWGMCGLCAQRRWVSISKGGMSLRMRTSWPACT